MNFWTFLDRNLGRVCFTVFVCVLISAIWGPVAIHEWRAMPQQQECP